MLSELPAALNTVRRAGAAWWREWLGLTALTLAALLAWASIALGPPATFALVRAATRVARGGGVRPRELVGHLRGDLVSSWLWLAHNVLALLLVRLNLEFYSRLPAPWAVGPLVATAVAYSGWLLVQFYALPYLMLQRARSLKLAYRDAALTILASPLYAVVQAAVLAAIAYACVRAPVLILLGAPAFLALLGAGAVAERLARFGLTPSDRPG